MKLIDEKIYLVNGQTVLTAGDAEKQYEVDALSRAKSGSISYKILASHNKGDDNNLKITFDALCSHDITYVNIIQTCRASGLKRFPMPYVLTNCHNSLCAVGGTINEDDHVFGLSAAVKYGGIYVPPHVAVIHQYMRECFAGAGKMILGSDSHTRYGALGTMAIGEGGPELVKQILGRTYDVKKPSIIAVILRGKVNHGVGPQDVALSIIGATFKNGFVKNACLEFVGDGVGALSMDYRIGVDVMTTEATCLSSVWITDDKTREYLALHGRESDYARLSPDGLAMYDKAIEIDLSEIEPMIALPSHPSNVYRIKDLLLNPYEILSEVETDVRNSLENKDIEFSLTNKIKGGSVFVDQAIIAGCAGGTYENVAVASNILSGSSIGFGAFSLSVYPSSLPVYSALNNTYACNSLIKSGAVIKTAFCGPCFGAGDVPSNGALSIRHTTRNFPQREGSKPSENQLALVALMDARSIAATAKNGGRLTSAADVEYSETLAPYTFDKSIYENRVFNGFGKADEDKKLIYGPNIADWPKIDELKDNLVLAVASVIDDAVTTTDELIPSGETSSYRSNPMRLAEFALSRKDPSYVSRAKKINSKARKGEINFGEIDSELSFDNCSFGSVICGKKVGDGSAREQAASCQRVLGGAANICVEYATKRYRSNLINWGMLPFRSTMSFCLDDLIIIKNVRSSVLNGEENVKAVLIRGNERTEITLTLDQMTLDEKQIILDGCLMNYYSNK